MSFVEFLLVEQGEGVMIACVPAKETRARGFGDKKTEQVEVKVLACLEVFGIETEVVKPPNLEGAVQGNSANVVFFFSHCRHRRISTHDTLTQLVSALQLIWQAPTAGN
jgi:hypothetical protein